MPIYEYYCEKCEQEFEEIVFGAELPNCPKCGEENCQKLISRPSKRRSGDSANGGGGEFAPSMPSAPSKCGGCSGGNCATC